MKAKLNNLQKKIVCAQSSAADGEPDDAIGFINQALALIPDLDTRKLLEKAGEEFSISHPPTGETYLELAFYAAGTKPAEETKPAALGKIKVYALSVDGPKCGTTGGAYATEREAFLSLLHNAGINEEETSHATELFDSGGDWIEYLQSITDLLTWNIDECEIQAPETPEQLASLKPAAVKLVGARIAELELQNKELLAALEKMLAIDDWQDEEIAPAALIAEARGAIAKAKGVKS